MIGYILIALTSLFIAFCCGAAAGHGVGYNEAYKEMLPILKNIEYIVGVMVGAKTVNKARSESNGTLRAPEEGDSGAP